MFDKLSCILCLEKYSSTASQINIDADEPQSLNVRETIERYFKEDLIMMSYFPTKIVCKQCWELLQSFHEFYVRVRNAHLTASNTLKSLQELEIAVTEIKMEPTVVDELAAPQKRRRGRPRRQNPTTVESKYRNDQDTYSAKECRTDSIPQIFLPIQQQNPTENDLEEDPIDALKLCTVRIDDKDGEDSPQDNKKEVEDSLRDKNLDFLNIKTEEIFEETMDVNYSPQLTDKESSSSSTEHDSPTKYEVTKKQILSKKKKTNSKRIKRKRSERSDQHTEKKPRHKTADYDEYIAKNFSLTCYLCHISLKNFRELKTHYRQQHKTNGYVKCCGKKLLKRGVLVDHIHFHNDPEYFKCQHCEKVMSDRRGLETHLQVFHGSRERVYNCDICKKGFFRREVLARHYLIHAPEEEKKVKCTQCEKTFCNKYGMNQHLKLVHLHLYAKICDICGKSFHGGEAFRRHQQEHSGLPRSLIKCELCGAELTTKYGLARHMKVMHTEEYQTPQVCPICSKVSPTLRAHLAHIKYVHTTQKKHACKLCDKAFKRPNDLREHMTTHTGEVLYTCTFCPQTFNSNANMYAHRKRKHPKEWAEKFLKKSTSTGIVQQIQNDLVSIIESVDAVEAK